MHPLLRRQLDRHAGGSAAVPPEWQRFIDAVDQAYAQADTDRRMLERSMELSSQELLQATRELARSNAELEQFAYVASHDLQEPLRTVQSYLQLLQRRYGEQLDTDAGEFIQFTVDAAGRMRQLIADLLAYARVAADAAPAQPTDCNQLLDRVRTALTAAIAESRAQITSTDLPTVPADARQLGQLLQNLIANALKFRADRPPRIHVSAERAGDQWQFAVADNGIGIDPQYADKVFAIFQRLHGAARYPGTGIGLALCKKIVERHGGRIWVDSVPGEGATFRFTLPAGP
jgi:light-regulated signal transduction histidine kinase (bacteriophytochrome)